MDNFYSQSLAKCVWLIISLRPHLIPRSRIPSLRKYLFPAMDQALPLVQ